MPGSKLSALAALAVEPADTDEFYINDGGVSKKIAWSVIKALFAPAGSLTLGTTAGITANANSSQGDTPLTTVLNEISTCATTGDAVTLPTAAAGLVVIVANNGAESADVFPASGDNAGGGVDTAIAVAAGDVYMFIAYDATNWLTIQLV